MIRRYDPLARVSQQIMLRDLAKLAALKEQQNWFLAEAEAEVIAAAGEAARMAAEEIDPSAAIAMAKYVAASSDRQNELKAKSRALEPDIEAARSAALRALNRSRAIEMLQARETVRKQAETARREERALTGVIGARKPL